MRRLRAGLRTVLLLAVALMVAAHPLARSLSLSHFSTNPALADLQVVICTAHGSVVIDEPLGGPQPTKEDPSCRWCAIGAGGALPALSTVQLGVLEPPRLLQDRIAASQPIFLSFLTDRLANTPRAPPRKVSA